jgi:hypothetical protein
MERIKSLSGGFLGAFRGEDAAPAGR